MAKLPFTGVPEEQAAPQLNFLPQPQQQAPIAADAQARQMALESAAADAHPTLNAGSLIATLAGLAGNVAGAASGRGAVGNSGLNLAEQLRSQAMSQQQQFMERARSEEQRIRGELKIEEDRQGRELRAKSLAPVIMAKVHGPEADAMLAQIAAGDVDGAQAAYKAYVDDERQRKMAELSDELRRKADIRSQEREDRIADYAEKSYKLREQNAQLQKDKWTFSSATARQKMADENIRQFTKETEVIVEPYTALQRLMADVGGLDNPKLEERLAEVAGLKRITAGSPLAARSQSKLYSNLASVFGLVGRSRGGTSLTSSEQRILTQALGADIFSPAFDLRAIRNPGQLASGLQALQQIMEARITEAGVNIGVPEIWAEYERRGGQLSKRAFTEYRQLVAETGPVDLDSPPHPEVAKDWRGMTANQKLKLIRELRGAKQ